MHFLGRWRFVEFVEPQPILGRDGIEHAKSVDRVGLLISETEADKIDLGARTVQRDRDARMNPQLAAPVQEDLLFGGNAGLSA